MLARKKLETGFVLLIYLIVQCCGAASSRRIENELAFVLEICHETLRISDSPFFHIFDRISEFPLVPLITSLHRSMIPTVSIRHVSNLERVVTQDRAKNILFFLDDCREILSLIWDFAEHEGIGAGDSPIKNGSMGLTSRLTEPLPHPCIQHESEWRSRLFPAQIHRPNNCDVNLTLTHCELEWKTKLSIELFDGTRRLARNRIFNSESNLIFFIRKNREESITLDSNSSEKARLLSCAKENVPRDFPECNLLLIFKFIWRTFQGYRTMICQNENCCFRYDPFFEKIIRYPGENKRFFDFSWSTFNGKSVFMASKNKIASEILPAFPMEAFNYVGLAVMRATITDFVSSRTGVYYNFNDFDIKRDNKSEDCSSGLMQDTDLFYVENGARVDDPSSYDFSPGLETSALCFIAPRKGFIPQYLVIFVSFSTEIWTAIWFTSCVCLVLLYFIRYFAVHFLHFFLTENERMCHERLSPLWSLFCYFLIVGHGRLLLDRLYSGKLLFFTLVFPFMILGVLLQSQMVTLISHRVRYADIETIEELGKSDLQIQSPNLWADRTLLSNSERYKSVLEKVTDSLKSLHSFLELNGLVIRNRSSVKSSLMDRLYYTGGNDSKYAESSRLQVEYINHAMKNDVFLTFHTIQLFKSMKSTALLFDRGEEFKYIDECIMSYPLILAFPKYSLYTKYLNYDFLHRFESGIIQRSFIQPYFRGQTVDLDDSFSNDPNRTRAYTTLDLSQAFLCLVCGLVSSCFMLSVELLSFEFSTKKILNGPRIFIKKIQPKKIVGTKVALTATLRPLRC